MPLFSLPRAAITLLAVFTTIHCLAEQTGEGRRLLIADDSKHRLAIISPTDVTEWEIKIDAIHDAWLLPNGNVLTQIGWGRLVEFNPEKEVVWEHDAAKMNGNDGRRMEVHAFQPLDNGLIMIAESGPARIIEIDRAGKIQHEMKLKVANPSAHSETRLVRKIANGNYLVAQESDGIVKEYSMNGDVVWEFPDPHVRQGTQGRSRP